VGASAVRLRPIRDAGTAQGMVNLLLELNVRVDFVKHGNGSVKGSESALASSVLYHVTT